MAEVSIKPVRLYDSDGDALDDGNGRLNVNAVLSASDNIEIGNVDIKLNGTGVSADEGNADAGTIRMTIADDDNHFGAIGTASDVDGNIHGQLRYIGTQSGDSATTLGTINTSLNNIESYVGLQLITTGEAYSEGHVHTTGFVRNDTLATLVTHDHDYTVLQVSSIGGLYVNGSEFENRPVQSDPLLVGGRYDSSARTLGDGDAGAVALTANGHLLIDVVDGGQLDALIDTVKTDTATDLRFHDIVRIENSSFDEINGDHLIKRAGIVVPATGTTTN